MKHALEFYGLHAARLVLIVVVALVVRLLLNRAVRRLVHTAVESSLPVVLRPLTDRVLEPVSLLSERRRQRTETLGSVLRSIVSFTVASVGGAMTLSELGLDLAPVVASAGIVGVAVGFGAQNLIKDFLTGMFMILEDQYGVGDVVDAGPATGTVEAVGLRTTRLRDVQGTVWHIRNGEIARVGNKSQGWARALVDVPVALDSDLAQVRTVALAAACSVFSDPDWSGKVLEEPQVWGLESIASTGLVLRLAVKTAPQDEGEVAREVRQRVVAAFEAAGIALAGLPATPSG